MMLIGINVKCIFNGWWLSVNYRKLRFGLVIGRFFCFFLFMRCWSIRINLVLLVMIIFLFDWVIKVFLLIMNIWSGFGSMCWNWLRFVIVICIRFVIFMWVSYCWVAKIYCLLCNRWVIRLLRWLCVIMGVGLSRVINGSGMCLFLILVRVLRNFNFFICIMKIVFL